jgi:hypothetical protein
MRSLSSQPWLQLPSKASSNDGIGAELQTREDRAMRPTEGQIALGGLAVLAIWLYFVLPLLYCSTCEAKGIGELLTGVATILLTITTFGLFKATQVLADATKVLAQDATQQSRDRKVLATARNWMEIRPKMTIKHFPDLKKYIKEQKSQGQQIKQQEIINRGQKSLPALRQLEAFASIINSNVYDFDTFYKISGGWFLRRYERIVPYITVRRERQPDEPPYEEMLTLQRRTWVRRYPMG